MITINNLVYKLCLAFMSETSKRQCVTNLNEKNKVKNCDVVTNRCSLWMLSS